MTSRRHRLPGLFGRVTAIASDHDKFDREVLRLRELASALADDAQRPAALAEIGVRCESLLRAMRRHFAAEEANSYFGVLLAETPSACVTVIDLCAQHAEILAMVEEVVVLCETEGSSTTLSERAEQLLSQLADRLAFHDRVEEALVHDFLLDPEPAQGS